MIGHHYQNNPGCSNRRRNFTHICTSKTGAISLFLLLSKQIFNKKVYDYYSNEGIEPLSLEKWVRKMGNKNTRKC